MKRKTLCYIAAAMALVAGILAGNLSPQIQDPFMQDLIAFLAVVCAFSSLFLLFTAKQTR